MLSELQEYKASLPSSESGKPGIFLERTGSPGLKFSTATEELKEVAIKVPSITLKVSHSPCGYAPAP